MKKLLLLAGIIGLFSVMTVVAENIKTELTTVEVSNTSDYCKGWAEGYCEGWKDVKGQFAICPITPLCPLPKLECYEGFRCGYNRGFLAGRRAAKGD